MTSVASVNQSVSNASGPISQTNNLSPLQKATIAIVQTLFKHLSKCRIEAEPSCELKMGFIDKGATVLKFDTVSKDKFLGPLKGVNIENVVNGFDDIKKANYHMILAHVCCYYNQLENQKLNTLEKMSNMAVAVTIKEFEQINNIAESKLLKKICVEFVQKLK